MLQSRSMRRLTLFIALLVCGSAGAQPSELVVHELTDPHWVVVNVDSRWVVHDERGFFVGYYQPLAPPRTSQGVHYTSGSEHAAEHGVHSNEHGASTARFSQGYAISHGQAPGTGSYSNQSSSSTFSFQPFNGYRSYGYRSSGYRSSGYRSSRYR